MNDNYTIGLHIGRNPDNLLYLETDKLVDNSTGIGVEVELEGINYLERRDKTLPDITTTWSIHSDGSLRNGTEFVFSSPYKGANIIKALEDLDIFIKAYDTKNSKTPITISDRCSVHIHMDVRDFNDIDLRNFLMWYVLFERIFFNAVSLERIKNNNCRPVTDSDIIPTLGDLNYYLEIHSADSIRGRVERLLSTIGNKCDKYSALNLLPTSNYGSVEFRHHRGTKNIQDILDWINIILSLKKWSINNKISDYINNPIIKDLKILNEVFSSTNLLKKLEDTNISDLLILGYYDLYQLINHNELVNSIKTCRKEIIDYCRIKKTPTLFWYYKKTNNLLVKKVNKEKVEKATNLSSLTSNPRTVSTSTISPSFDAFISNYSTRSSIASNSDSNS